MSNRLFTMIKSFVIPILAIVILLVVAGYALSGCQGGQTKSIQDRYPLESVAKEGKQESYVYRAANRSVPEVAKELINEREPKQASKEDENQMFLVYSDKIYNLQKDKEQPSDTLIEISNKEFVRQNYQPSFLQGYIMGSILNDIFGSKNHHLVIIEDIMTDKIINQLFQKGHLRKKKRKPRLQLRRKGKDLSLSEAIM